MTLEEWAESRGLSDREVAVLMTGELRKVRPGAREVSTAAVQKYRTNVQIPGRDRMQAIHQMTSGWVDANDFFGLKVVG